MKQAEKTQKLMKASSELYQYTRELNRWQSADPADIERIETLLNRCIDAITELENTITEGQSE